MQLASRFANRSPVLRSNHPLSDDQIRTVAPSIFADTPHESRSERYSYIPTAAVLTELRKEGFQPFMVCQTRVRQEDRRDYTKHMLRLRHASQINGAEANEIILLNSHDGTSSYQMLAGMFRFVCQNGLVCGDTFADVRVPHKGNVTDHVIEGAYEVLHGFEQVQDSRDAMRAITLDDGEAEVFARSALVLKYDEPGKTLPITESQILRPPSLRRQPCGLVVHVQPGPGEPRQRRPDRPQCQRAPAAHTACPRHRPKRPSQPGTLVARGRPATVESLTSSSGSCPYRHGPLFLCLRHPRHKQLSAFEGGPRGRQGDCLSRRKPPLPQRLLIAPSFPRNQGG
jgi:hypothetical protein